MFVRIQSSEVGEGRESQLPKLLRIENLKGAEGKECVRGPRCVWDWDTPDPFPPGAHRESQASKCRLCVTRGGRMLGSAIPAANSRPWASQIPENLCFSAELVPRESPAALPRWEPAQSHAGKDISAFTGTEPPQICVFC